MTWALMGGPHHAHVGNGPVPDGYVLFSAGGDLPYVFDAATRAQDEVYRWHEDVQYLADGRRIIDNYESGQYATRADLANLVNSAVPLALETLRHHLSRIADAPASEAADQARALIDTYRAHDLI